MCHASYTRVMRSMRTRPPPPPCHTLTHTRSLLQAHSHFFHKKTPLPHKVLTCCLSLSRTRSLPPTPSLSRAYSLSLAGKFLAFSYFYDVLPEFVTGDEPTLAAIKTATLEVLSSYVDTFLHVRTHLYTSVEFVICRVRDSRSVYLCFQHHHSRGRIWIHVYMCIFRFQLREWRRAYSRCF